MSILLKAGQEIELRDGQCVTVVNEIGRGGQGIVYRVRLNGTNKLFALKWLFPGCMNDPQNFYRHLYENIKIGAPSRTFVWPQQLTKFFDGEAFGYIMRIIPDSYKRFSTYLTAREQFSSVGTMVNSTLYIVLAMKQLHRLGYSYNDLHDGNLFIDPKSGKVLICDTDNVCQNGESSGIIGKPYYIAPEVVVGKNHPDKYTDRHSLAVLLFQILIGDHPLIGKRTMVPVLTDRHEKKFFGTNPLFIYDKDDNSNMPVSGLHENACTMWKFFPSFLKKFFQRAFSQECLFNRSRRPLEQQWLSVLMRLKSSIVRCPYCGEELFLESDRETKCFLCNNSFKVAGYLSFNNRQNIEVTVPVFKNALLYNWHMNLKSEDFLSEEAIVLERHGRFGLKNNSQYSWEIETPTHKHFLKNPGEVLTLGAGFKIDFGNDTVANVIRNV